MRHRDALRAAARQRKPADLTETGRVRRMYVTHGTRRGGDGGRVSLGRWRA